MTGCFSGTDFAETADIQYEQLQTQTAIWLRNLCNEFSYSRLHSEQMSPYLIKTKSSHTFYDECIRCTRTFVALRCCSFSASFQGTGRRNFDWCAFVGEPLTMRQTKYHIWWCVNASPTQDKNSTSVLPLCTPVDPGSPMQMARRYTQVIQLSWTYFYRFKACCCTGLGQTGQQEHALWFTCWKKGETEKDKFPSMPGCFSHSNCNGLNDLLWKIWVNERGIL